MLSRCCISWNVNAQQNGKMANHFAPKLLRKHKKHFKFAHQRSHQMTRVWCTLFSRKVSQCAVHSLAQYQRHRSCRCVTWFCWTQGSVPGAWEFRASLVWFSAPGYEHTKKYNNLPHHSLNRLILLASLGRTRPR